MHGSHVMYHVFTKKRSARQAPLYVDSSFPATGSAIFRDPALPAGETLRSLKRYMKDFYGYDIDQDPVQWLRPGELCRLKGLDEPQFVVDGYTMFDMNQGMIGDCWYIAGAAHITRNSDLLHQVIPSGQNFGKNYTGMFRFNFWHDGQWVEVTVDDYLPCKTKNDTVLGLLGMSNWNQPNEFWSPLLEKAYAKLFNSYEGIHGGVALDSMADISNGVTVSLTIHDTPVLVPMAEALNMDLGTLVEKHDLFNEMDSNFTSGGLMALGSADFSKKKRAEIGIVENHAYTVTGVRLVKDTQGVEHRLVRLKNPYGSKPNNGMDIEWLGAWGDGSADWDTLAADDQQEMHVNDPQDGQFWISYEDLTKYFTALDICTMLNTKPGNSKDGNKNMWKLTTFISSWAKGTYNSGPLGLGKDNYWKNPQFKFQVDDDMPSESQQNVIISLVKSNYRALNSDDMYYKAAFDIFRLVGDTSKPLTAANYKDDAVKLSESSDTDGWYRELQQAYTLPPGHYAAIPSARCEHCTQESLSFSLRIFLKRN